MNHYWSLNFNSQSSLLSGAVVAGDAGNTSIYFNPATISEIQNGSNLSFAAALFTWGIYHYTDALGDNINITNVSFNVQPQFMSYSYRPVNSKFAFAISALTRMKEKFDVSYYAKSELDIIERSPGPEVYDVTFKYFLDFHDSWFGFATSYDVSEKFKIGGSLFLSAAYISYKTQIRSLAFSVNDTLWVDSIPRPGLVSEGSYSEDIRFTDYRLIGKIGFSYVTDRWRFGLNFTTQSFSLFSTGKEAHRLEKVANITNPENDEFIPGYVITNGLRGNHLKTKIKNPFSISFGFIHEIDQNQKRLYFTMEYFHGISPYKMVSAPITDDITSNLVYDKLQNKDWLSIADVAKPVLNVAIGYRWQLSDNLMFLNGFRTDFNNINGADYGDLNDYNKINSTNINIYHYTGGVQFYFLQKYLLVAGGELSFGYDKNQSQMANFTNPVEYDPKSHRVLQGIQEDKMGVYYFGINVYISATFKFNSTKKRDNKK